MTVATAKQYAGPAAPETIQEISRQDAKKILFAPWRLGVRFFHPAKPRITSAAFWPPKPKLVETAVRTRISRAQFGT
jgi:hypothetical protein